MKTFKLEKLVKDHIVDLMISQDQKPVYRTLGDQEFAAEIRKKIVEEALEFQASGDLNELRDLLMIIQAAKTVENPGSSLIADGEPVEAVFKNRIFIETVSLADDNEWVKYYKSDPERFPEVIPRGQ